MARGPGRGIESLQNISDRFCQLVFKNRLGFRELEVNFISVRDDASLVFVLITRFSTVYPRASGDKPELSSSYHYRADVFPAPAGINRSIPSFFFL